MTWLERSGVAETEIGRMLQSRFSETSEVEQYRARMLEASDVVEADRADVIVYREVFSAILDELKTSDIVRAARAKVEQDGYESLTEQDRDGLLRAFDRARANALRKVDLSDAQERRLRFAMTSELNYGLRHYIREGTPEDWMILDPKLRRVDFMDTTHVLRYLRNSLTPSADVAFIEADPDITPETKAAVAAEPVEQAA